MVRHVYLRCRLVSLVRYVSIFTYAYMSGKACFSDDVASKSGKACFSQDVG